MTHEKGKVKTFCFGVLDVLFGGLEAPTVAWAYAG
jgi:hypothetical protein